MARAKSKADSKKAVATKPATDLTTPDTSQIDFDFESDAGAGMETADKDSYAIPFLRVLQKGSPQCEETAAEFMKEAKPGMFFNTVSRQLLTEVVFLPCAFQRRFIRWAARSGEGGFKGEMLPEDAAVLKEEGVVVSMDNHLYFPSDDGSVNPKKCDSLADVRNHFGLVLDEDGNASQVLLSLTSTQIKKSKTLMTLLSSSRVRSNGKMVTPPTWCNKIRIMSVAESNDQGSWYGVRFESAGHIFDADLYAAAKDFHSVITAGAARVNYSQEEDRPASF